MEKCKDSVPQPEKNGAAPTDKTSSGYPAQAGHPYGGVPAGNVTAGYPAQPGVVILPLTVGPDSCTVVCPTCHQTVQTDVRVVSTTKTHLSAVLLAAFGCCLCCWVPYYVDSLRAKHHYCPNCKAFIAAYDR
ncbi:lipopolysaccharide-induced tumor necrosis factor-alpha factor homolog isoform X2 [Schistocerca nitens]|uniref:lipopolysaccharide-induced tumor necrosis factor-alpha factor homolog isoform X2 n=1 Tax=Schistocerca nitens TaxID=7011 RepID=UPI00211869E2|nr:lipopolysaccharide-induced tumor necrosis factor-alpha factor homolog isoform X2 [Schistocerca nitens]